MKTLCRIVGHRWIEPEWISYDAWEKCARCPAQRKAASIDSLVRRFGLHLLVGLPDDVSTPVLERLIRGADGQGGARFLLRQLGLTIDAQPNMRHRWSVPPSWLPSICHALEAEGDPSNIQVDAVERFVGAFGRDALPYLLNAIHSNLVIAGAKVSDRVTGQTEIAEYSSTGEEEEYGGSMGRSERGYHTYYDIYVADVVEQRFTAVYPIAAGAKAALRRLMCDDEADAELIVNAIRAYDERIKDGVVTCTTQERKNLLRTDSQWTSTYRDVDAR